MVTNGFTGVSLSIRGKSGMSCPNPDQMGKRYPDQVTLPSPPPTWVGLVKYVRIGECGWYYLIMF